MLKGEKVILRPMEREDQRRFHELTTNVALGMLVGNDWEPRSLADIEKGFERDSDGSHERTRFAIEADGKVIGDIGLHGLRRREGVTEFWIGILDPDYLGKGYGRDAIKTLLWWAFRVQNWRKVWLSAVAVNERALRSYRACGFIEEGRLRQHVFYNGQYFDEIKMGLLRTEWEAANPNAHDPTV